MSDVCMVFNEHANAFDCFDYTPEALIEKAAELHGTISYRSTVEILDFTSSLFVDRLTEDKG